MGASDVRLGLAVAVGVGRLRDLGGGLLAAVIFAEISLCSIRTVSSFAVSSLFGAASALEGLSCAARLAESALCAASSESSA